MVTFRWQWGVAKLSKPHHCPCPPICDRYCCVYSLVNVSFNKLLWTVNWCWQWIVEKLSKPHHCPCPPIYDICCCVYDHVTLWLYQLFWTVSWCDKEWKIYLSLITALAHKYATDAVVYTALSHLIIYFERWFGVDDEESTGGESQRLLFKLFRSDLHLDQLAPGHFDSTSHMTNRIWKHNRETY